MKKIYSFFFVFLLALSANAQLTTNSNNDANGKAAVSDATETVDATILNSVLKAIDDKLQKMSDRISTIEGKLGIEAVSEDDPYNGHEYVDLGLSVKWATCNLGANSPEDYGDYYAWGETSAYGEAPSAYPSSYDKTPNHYYTNRSTKVSYWWDTYKYLTDGGKDGTSCSKYQIADNETSSVWYKDGTFIGDNKKVLDKEDDAACVKWNGSWRMPTFEELLELCDNCYWEWVTSYNGKSVNGFVVYQAKANADKGRRSFNNPSLVGSYSTSDPHIFLPASGSCVGSPSGIGADGHYLSSSLNKFYTSASYGLYFSSDHLDRYFGGSRCWGFSIRPVCQ